MVPLPVWVSVPLFQMSTLPDTVRAPPAYGMSTFNVAGAAIPATVSPAIVVAAVSCGAADPPPSISTCEPDPGTPEGSQLPSVPHELSVPTQSLPEVPKSQFGLFPPLMELKA